MAVAYDAVTGDSSEWSFLSADPYTFTHTPSGTPRAVVLFLFQTGSSSAPTDCFTGPVTYGGVSMTAVTGGRAVDSATEGMSCKAYFLGASIPTGAQTVSIDHDTAIDGSRVAVCVTLTASGDTTISGTPVLLQENQTLSEQNVNSGADVALRIAAITSGLASAPAAGANSTRIYTGAGSGARSVAVARENTGGSGSRPVGFSSGTADDCAAVHLAIAETGGGGGGAITRSFAVIVG